MTRILLAALVSIAPLAEAQETEDATAQGYVEPPLPSPQPVQPRLVEEDVQRVIIETAGDPEPEPVVAEYLPSEAASGPALHVNGYLDLGFAKASGNGSSFHDDEWRLPVDYAADAFAPAVNSRGDVASADPTGRFTNGFLPRSMRIGDKPSFLLNTVTLDVRYQPVSAKTMAFVRLQVLPRLDALLQDSDQLLLQQAFLRFIPFESQEFAITVGKFDSVFGIEYLDNESPLRIGVTPSLIARYTTGWQVGAKAFYRLQLPSLWSALSVNAAVTTNSPEVPALAPSALSIAGAPFFSARLGYELNPPDFQVKLGLSGSRGPRADQTDPGVIQLEYGADARLLVGFVYLAAEVMKLEQEEGGADKVGSARLVSAFDVWGASLLFAVGLPLPLELVHKATVYGRYDRRIGGFTDFTRLDTQRYTGGIRFDAAEGLALKAEYLVNQELAGAASVDNDVFTSSLVYAF